MWNLSWKCDCQPNKVNSLAAKCFTINSIHSFRIFIHNVSAMFSLVQFNGLIHGNGAWDRRTGRVTHFIFITWNFRKYWNQSKCGELSFALREPRKWEFLNVSSRAKWNFVDEFRWHNCLQSEFAFQEYWTQTEEVTSVFNRICKHQYITELIDFPVEDVSNWRICNGGESSNWNATGWSLVNIQPNTRYKWFEMLVLQFNHVKQPN